MKGKTMTQNMRPQSKITLNGELMFPSDYLNAEDVRGKELTLTITGVSKEDLQLRGGGKKIKPVLTFAETPKKLVCVPTNGESIRFLHGNRAEKWVGKQITLYQTRCQGWGSMVDCVRIRETNPANTGQPAADDQDQTEYITREEAVEAMRLCKAGRIDQRKLLGKYAITRWGLLPQLHLADVLAAIRNPTPELVIPEPVKEGMP